MHCLTVPRWGMHYHWRTVAMWISKGCRAGGFDVDPGSLKLKLFDTDEALLVLIREDESCATVGCMVVEIGLDEPRIHVTCAGGLRHMGAWIAPAARHLDEICRVLKYREITLAGRPGWRRRLAPYGYEADPERGPQWLVRRVTQ
jgi:hypothetical protein